MTRIKPDLIHWLRDNVMTYDYDYEYDWVWVRLTDSEWVTDWLRMTMIVIHIDIICHDYKYKYDYR